MNKPTIRIRLAKLSLTSMSREEGLVLRSLVEQLWSQCDKIVLDFKGMGPLSISFADEAFAKLFIDRSRIKVLERIEFKNISVYTKNRINSLIEGRIRHRLELKPGSNVHPNR